MSASRPAILHPSCPRPREQRACGSLHLPRLCHQEAWGPVGAAGAPQGPETLLGPSRFPAMVLVHATPVLTAASEASGTRQARPPATQPPPRLAGSWPTSCSPGSRYPGLAGAEVGGSRGADWWVDVIPQTSPHRGSPVALKGLHCSTSSSHKSVLGGLPWQSSGYDSELPLQGAQVPSLVGQPRSRMMSGGPTPCKNIS